MPHDYTCKIPAKHTLGAHCPTCQDDDSERIIKARWGGKAEPDIVYNLFFDPTSASDWTNFLKGWTPALLYAAVFIHQRPYVRFNALASTPVSATNPGIKRCELGDLLVVFTDTPALRRVAALFQAKMSTGTWPPTTPNPAQWELYTTWPTFSYNPNSPYPAPGRQYRTLPFKGSDDPSGQYLKLTAPASGVAAAVDASEAFPRHAFIVWSRVINRLLNGAAGRDFSWTRTAARNDWDELIWDLLDYTWHQAKPGFPAGGAPNRGVGAYLLAHRGIIDSTDGHGPSDFPAPNEDSGWGIPVIHIIRE